jgi:DNA-binding MurR/RpiR family transcriptional regulator
LPDQEQALRRAEADKRALREKLAAEQSRHLHYVKEHKSEVHSLKQLLREARDMLDSTQASLEAQSGSEAAIIEQVLLAKSACWHISGYCVLSTFTAL